MLRAFFDRVSRFPLAWTLLILSVFTRFIAMNQSLWLDEAITAVTVQKYGFVQLVTTFAPTDFHPPLYYLLMRAWVLLLGDSEISLRLPSLLLSLLAGYWVFRAGKQLGGESVGLWSAVFLMWNPLLIYYSQEARMYSLVVTIIAANFAALINIMEGNRKKKIWLSYLSTLVLSPLTFYGSVFYLGALALFLLWRRQWKVLGVTSAICTATVLVISPLLMAQFQNSQVARAGIANWSLVLGTVSVKNLLLIPIKLTSGRISFEPKVVYYALAAGWLAITGLVAMIGAIRRRWLFGFLVAPLLLGLAFSAVVPLLQYFRFLYLIIFLSLLLGLAVKRMKHLAPVLVTGFVMWSLAYLLIPPFHREDWQALASYLQAERTPVYLIPSAADPLTYYAPNLEITPLSDLMTESAQPETLITLPYVADIHGLDYQTTLQDKGYHLQEEFSVRGLSAEKWVKISP